MKFLPVELTLDGRSAVYGSLGRGLIPDTGWLCLGRRHRDFLDDRL